MQALVSVPKLRDFCLEPAGPHQLKKGPIGSALQELVQTVYGEQAPSYNQLTCSRCLSHLVHMLTESWRRVPTSMLESR